MGLIHHEPWYRHGGSYSQFKPVPRRPDQTLEEWYAEQESLYELWARQTKAPFEEDPESKEDLRSYQQRWYSSLSKEEKEALLERQRKKNKEWHRSRTPEQVEEKRRKNLERFRALTPEQREQKRKKDQEWRRKRKSEASKVREAVRPIRLNPGEVEGLTEQLWKELLWVMDSDYPRPNSPLPINKEIWEPKYGPRLQVQTVMGNTTPLPVTIKFTPADIEEQGDQVIYRGLRLAGYLRLSNPPVLAISFNFGGLPAGVAKQILQTRTDAIKEHMSSVVSHELTHAKDKVTVPEYDSFKMDDPVTYYNDPTEVRAYMQQIAREVAQVAGDHEEYESQSSEWIMKLLNESHHWQMIQGHLRPENRKKIIQGVVTHLLDLGYDPTIANEPATEVTPQT